MKLHLFLIAIIRGMKTNSVDKSRMDLYRILWQLIWKFIWQKKFSSSSVCKLFASLFHSNQSLWVSEKLSRSCIIIFYFDLVEVGLLKFCMKEEKFGSSILYLQSDSNHLITSPMFKWTPYPFTPWPRSGSGGLSSSRCTHLRSLQAEELPCYGQG